VLIDGRVTLFDCIEFSEDLRWIDVASEMAFLYIDLLDQRQPGLACWLLNEWLARTGDHDAVQVLRFYAVYRALVRAKVAAIRVATTPPKPLSLCSRSNWRESNRCVPTNSVAWCRRAIPAYQALRACHRTVCRKILHINPTGS
jgi:hypothetical protein